MRERLLWSAVYALRTAEALTGLGSRVVGTAPTFKPKPKPKLHTAPTFKPKPKPKLHTAPTFKPKPHVVHDRDAAPHDPGDAPPPVGQEESWAKKWKARAGDAIRKAQEWAQSGNATLRDRAASVGKQISRGAEAVARVLQKAGGATMAATLGGLGGLKEAAENLYSGWKSMNFLLLLAAVAAADSYFAHH